MVAGEWWAKEQILRLSLFDTRMEHAVTVCPHASHLPSIIIINKLMHLDKNMFTRWLRRRFAPSSCAQHSSEPNVRTFHEFAHTTRHDTMGLYCMRSHLLFRFMQKLIARNSSFGSAYLRRVTVNSSTTVAQNVRQRKSQKKLYCLFFSTEL